MKLANASLSVQRVLNGSFHHRGSLVKLWNGIFSARKDLESHVKLMQASLGVRKDVERSFHLSGGSVKLVHASLGVQRVPNSSFHHYEGLVKLWNSSSIQRPRKQYQPLWQPCEACACLFTF